MNKNNGKSVQTTRGHGKLLYVLQMFSALEHGQLEVWVFKIGLELKLGPPHTAGGPVLPTASQRIVLYYNYPDRVHVVTALKYPAHDSTLTKLYHIDSQPARLARETSGMSLPSLWES